MPPGTAGVRDFSHLAPRLPQLRRRAVRRLHGLRQRLPRQRDPRDRRAGVGPAVRHRRVRCRRRRAGGRRRGPPLELRPDEEVRRGPRAQRRPARRVRALHRSGPLQGLRRVRRGLRLARARRAVHDRQVEQPAREHRRRSTSGREMRFLRVAAADARRLSEREGPGRPDARRACLRVCRRGGFVCRLRRRDRDPDDGRGDPAGLRAGLDGDRRGHRLQLRLRGHLPVQPVPRAVDELPVRERARRRVGDPHSAGTRPVIRSGVCGSWAGMARCTTSASRPCRGWSPSGADIKVLVLDTQVYSNTGGQASTASFGGQVTKLSAFGAALHGRPEPRKELGRILMAHGEVYVAQTTPAHLNHFYRSILEANEYPGPCRRDRLLGVHARARDRRRRRQPSGAACRRFAGVPAVHLRPPSRARGCAIACRSRAIPPSARTGRGRPRRAGRLPCLRQDRRALRAPLRSGRRRRPRSWRPSAIASRPGGPSRSWRASRPRLLDRIAHEIARPESRAMVPNGPAQGAVRPAP